MFYLRNIPEHRLLWLQLLDPTRPLFRIGTYRANLFSILDFRELYRCTGILIGVDRVFAPDARMKVAATPVVARTTIPTHAAMKIRRVFRLPYSPREDTS